MITAKFISSLDKVFPDQSLSEFSEITSVSALLGETVSAQLLYTLEPDEEGRSFTPYAVSVSGELAGFTTLREVKNVGVQKPVGVKSDANYLRTTPGIFPDLLYPLPKTGAFCAALNLVNTIWIDVNIPDNKRELAGDRTLTLTVTRKGQTVSEHTLTVKIIPANLPEQKLICTQWFSAESISEYYCVKPYSKRFYDIARDFLKKDREAGSNMIMLPLFSGLCGITKKGDKFSFSFTRLTPFLNMCLDLGYKYFEVPHFFTAGDAAWAARVIYREDGEEKNLRGLRASDPIYVSFLRGFITAFRKYMKARGLEDKIYFHIADEPALKNIELFRAAKNSIIDLLEGCNTIDAIFDIEYWREGLINRPVPISDNIEPFIEADVPNLWVYYCCGPQTKCSNRFIAQSGACTRSIGMQLYKFRLEGFLHWALCNYHSGDTGGLVNPYVEHSGKSWVPGGDTFLLYPANDGTAHQSLRHCIFRDAMQDIRAMELCESFTSHDEVVAAIEEELGFELRFSTCAPSTDAMTRVRERINRMILEHI